MYVGAALGCSLGVLRFPKMGLRLSGDPDVFMAGPRQWKMRIDEVTRAVRWHRIAPPFTAADIERQVKEAIRLHKESGRFMFGVADQVPPNGDLELVRLVGELVEQHGRY